MSWSDRVQDQWEDEYIGRMWGSWVRTDVVSWLQRRRWDLFWTQTYRRAVTEQGAAALWSSFLAGFNSHLPLTAVLWVVEPHTTLASHHVHALLSTKSPMSFSLFNKRWRIWKEDMWKRFGKALILKTTSQAPIWYCLKYLTKKPKTDQVTPAPKDRENLWGVWTPHSENDSLDTWMEDGP